MLSYTCQKSWDRSNKRLGEKRIGPSISWLIGLIGNRSVTSLAIKKHVRDVRVCITQADKMVLQLKNNIYQTEIAKILRISHCTGPNTISTQTQTKELMLNMAQLCWYELLASFKISISLSTKQQNICKISLTLVPTFLETGFLVLSDRKAAAVALSAGYTL